MSNDKTKAFKVMCRHNVPSHAQTNTAHTHQTHHIGTFSVTTIHLFMMKTLQFLFENALLINNLHCVDRSYGHIDPGGTLKDKTIRQSYI